MGGHLEDRITSACIKFHEGMKCYQLNNNNDSDKGNDNDRTEYSQLGCYSSEYHYTCIFYSQVYAMM